MLDNRLTWQVESFNGDRRASAILPPSKAGQNGNGKNQRQNEPEEPVLRESERFRRLTRGKRANVIAITIKRKDERRWIVGSFCRHFSQVS